MSVAIFPVSIKGKSNAPRNISLLGMTNLHDTRAVLETFFKQTFAAINDLEGKIIPMPEYYRKQGIDNGQIFLVEAGDLSYAKSIKGHDGFNSKFHCTACTIPKAPSMLAVIDPLAVHPFRAHDGCTGKSISRTPLQSMPGERFCPPGLHILLGILTKALTLHLKLVTTNGNIDDEYTEEEESLRKEYFDMTYELKYSEDAVARLRHVMNVVRRITSGDQTIPTATIHGTCSKNYCLLRDGEGDKCSTQDSDWIPFSCLGCADELHVTCEGHFDLNQSDMFLIPATDYRRFCAQCRKKNTPNHLMENAQESMAYHVSRSSVLRGKMKSLEDEMTVRTKEKQGDNKVRAKDVIKEMKKKMGVYSTGHFDSLIGKHARILTKPENAAQLWELVSNVELRRIGIQLFLEIGKIFHLMHVEIGQDGHAEEVEQVAINIHKFFLLLNPAETFTPKCHMLAHVPGFIRENGYWNKAADGAVESYHQLIASLAIKNRGVQSELSKYSIAQKY